MYISNISILNFRNFDYFNGELNDGLSIIIGENNGGKSNFLEALSLIFNRDYSMRKRVLNQEDFWNGLIIQERWPEIVIEATLQGIETENELAITSRWLTRVPGEAKLTYKYRPKANISIPAPTEEIPINKVRIPLNEYEWVIYGGELETLDAFDFNMLSKFGVEYVGALRDATSELKKSSGQLQRILRNFNLEEEELQKISEKINELNEQIMRGNELKNVQKEINQYLAKISGSTRQSVKIQMSDSDYDTLLKDLKVVIGARDDNVHAVELNGLGYNNLLYISLLLAQHAALKKKRLQEHDYFFPILIVEEPEAHLHSNLQKYLASYFFNEDTAGQVIMTSHSSHVSSHSSLDSLIIFYKKEGKNRSKRIGTIFDEKIKEERRFKRYLERWLDATKSDIFFSRKILLVEGIAERLLLPEFFSMIYTETIEEGGKEIVNKRTIEGEGISIISVDGVAFRPFLQLFGPSGLNIKCVALTDSDPEAMPVTDDNGNSIIGKLGKEIKEEVYPTEIGEYEVCARTEGLLKDYTTQPNISIFNNIKTFEYDLLINENKEFFNQVIQENNVGTKEKREQLLSLEGQEFAKLAYEMISSTKGEFSQLILDELKNGKLINVPEYIKNAFDNLMLEGAREKDYGY